MSSDRYLTAIADQFAISMTYRAQKGYYRSKLFVTSSTTNPLVAAASPILSLLERLGMSPTLPSIELIRENIAHELQAFHSRLMGQQYPHEFIVVANYLLSATIDELLGKNYLRLYNKPAEFQSFTPVSPDDSHPERRFFDILHYLKQRTNQYLDILELAYYCLITGFEGEHHQRSDGRQALDNLIEELYRSIQKHRVNKPYRLFNEPMNLTEPMTFKPIVLRMALAVSVMIGVYISSNILLENKAEALLYSQTRGMEWTSR